MTTRDIIARERRTLVGEESTFGVLPDTMTEIVLQHDDLHIDGLGHEMLEVNDARVRRADAIAPVKGLKRARDFNLGKQYLKALPSGLLLPSGGTPTEFSSRILLRHAFGAEHAAAGTTVASATSATSFTLTAAAGFIKGTWVLVSIAGKLEPTKITALSVATVTCSPALSAQPEAGAVVRQMYNFAIADSHKRSLSVQQAFVGASEAQYEARGIYGDVSWELPEFGKLASLMFKGKSTTSRGPESLALATTVVTDDLGGALPWEPEVFIATSISRSSPTIVETVSFSHENKWEEIRSGTGIETVAGVMNTGGRPTAAKFGARVRFDTDFDTDFDAGTELEVLVVQRWGDDDTTASGLWLWEGPRVRLDAKPKAVKVGERLYFDLSGRGLADTSVTRAAETGTALDFIVTPWRCAVG